jgi:hypothetical protein
MLLENEDFRLADVPSGLKTMHGPYQPENAVSRGWLGTLLWEQVTGNRLAQQVGFVSDGRTFEQFRNMPQKTHCKDRWVIF